MVHKGVRFYVILALMISSFLNAGFFLDDLISVNDNKRNSVSSNTAGAGLINFGGIIVITEGNFSGSGNLLGAENYGQTEGNKQGLVTNTTLQVSCADWNGTAIQIDVTQMEANASTVGELQKLEAKILPTGGGLTSRYAQELQIPFLTTFLTSVTPYLYITRYHSGNDIFIEIWNATYIGGFKPNQRISQVGFDLGTGDPVDYAAGFLLPFSTQVELKSSQTVGNLFYIAITENGPQGYVSWYGANDSLETDEYNAWLYSASTWISYGFDFSLNTTLKGSPLPSEVNLRINGTSVTDIISGNGTYYSSFSKDLRSPLLFTVNTNYKVKLNLKWALSISQMQAFNSNFYIQGDWSHSKWNATQTVAFFMNTYSRSMNITIPKWNIERVVWNGAQFSDWMISLYPNYQKVTILNANNGTWTVECNSTNYIKELQVRRETILTYLVNCTDTVNIYTNFRQKLATGAANLTAFPISAANYSDSVQILGNTSIQFTPWTINDTATANPGGFTLQVSWYNGTEVGLNATSLNVLSIPTKLTHLRHTVFVATGDSIYASVNFSNSYNNGPIAGASLLVKNSTNNAIWPVPFQIIRDYLNGTYDIEILTLGLDAGEYSFSINLSKPLYLSSEVSGLSVTIGGGPSNVSVTAPGCIGLLKLNSSFALANPAPYHNATIKVKVFYYNAFTLQPLSGGIVSAAWIGGGPATPWVPAYFGYYNITIDVTGFHAGTNHTLRIAIQQVGYTAAVLYVIVPIKKLPTVIEPVETYYEAYLEESITVFAVFKDTISGESIPSVYDLGGNFTIRINACNQNMTLLLPNLGIYRSTLILSQLDLEQGKTYNITLLAFSLEHELSIMNISLNIIPKSPVYLVLLALPPYFLAGTEFKLYAQVTTSNGTPLYNLPLIYKRIFYPGSLITQTTEITNGTGFCELSGEALATMQSVLIKLEYLGNMTVQNGTISSTIIPIIKLNSSITLSNLPAEIREDETLRINATLLINGLPAAGRLIIFTFSYEGSDEIDILTIGTNVEGIASAVLIVPIGVSRLFVTASFEGVSYINASSGAVDVSVISLTILVWRYAPIWLSITLAIVGGTLTYKYGYKRTKINRLKSKWNATAQKFQNSLNVNFLLIILKNSGLSLYNHSFKGEKVDYELMSGFLSAISMFKRELIKTDKKEIVKQPEWEMSYQEFKIYGIDREYVQFIFILEESPSATLKKIISEFIVDTEDKFQEMFATFMGDTTEFKEIDSLIKYHFETSLVLPHYTVNLSDDQLKQLSDLERQIYNLAQMFMKQQGYFYIPNLLNSISEMSKKEKNQILHEIYGLIKKNYFTASRMSLLLE